MAPLFRVFIAPPVSSSGTISIRFFILLLIGVRGTGTLNIAIYCLDNVNRLKLDSDIVANFCQINKLPVVPYVATQY